MNIIKDGIYLNLPNAAYHADKALGSTNIKALLRSAAHYWYKSSLNPNHHDKCTAPIFFGTALHKLVLEGEKAFQNAYEIKTARGTTKAGKAQKAKAEAEGKELIDQDMHDRIYEARDAITQNSATAHAFSDGLPEVSVFWTRKDGIRCKARFDYLKFAAIVDLKSLSNSKGFEISKAAYHALAEYEYLLSAAWYLEARQQLKSLCQQGFMFGATKSQAAFIQKCTQIQSCAFVWVFYQTTDEPAVYGIMADNSSQSITKQYARIELAIERYQAALALYGEDAPWQDQQQNLETFDQDNLPAWYRI